MYDSIYITDETTIYKYFKRQPSLVYEIIPENKQYNVFRLFPEFYEGPIEADMLVKLLLNKRKEVEINNRRIYVWENKSLEKFDLYVERLAIDYKSNYLLK